MVVTGAGVVSPLGLDAPSTWEALVAGRSGVGRITSFDPADYPVRIAAEVKGFDARAHFGKYKAGHKDRFTQMALVATREAMAQSGLVVADPFRVGVVYGTGIGGIGSLEANFHTLRDKGADKVSPYMCPMMIPNMAAGEIAMDLGIMGPAMCTVTACSASASAIGDGFEMIRSGRVDAVIAGGAEAAITPICIAGFAAMKALSTRNDDPQSASRPFDATRDGFVSGEGAATLILEDRERALARDAVVLGEILGYGATCDAYHPTAPHPEGLGATAAMRFALEQAAISGSDLGYINAHGTSTPHNDRIETAAVRDAVGTTVPMSSTKSMTGHLLGAAGALEAFVCLMALRTGVLPPTINYLTPDPECDLDYVPNTARAAQIEFAMTNSFGFGGHNVALVLARADRSPDAPVNRPEAFRTLTHAIADVLDIDPDTITMESRFKEDLEVDSLGIIELILVIEEEIGVKIQEEEAEVVVTVGGAYELVCTRMGI